MTHNLNEGPLTHKIQRERERIRKKEKLGTLKKERKIDSVKRKEGENNDSVSWGVTQ